MVFVVGFSSLQFGWVMFDSASNKPHLSRRHTRKKGLMKRKETKTKIKTKRNEKPIYLQN